MSEPEIFDREDCEMYAAFTGVPWTEKLKASMAHTAVELHRQVERLRLELACERGEGGPWTALGWCFDVACWGWRDASGRDVCVHEPDESGASVWSAGDGGKMRRVGGAQTSLAAIEQACDALGIKTTWPRP